MATDKITEVVVDGIKRQLQETSPGMYTLLPIRAIDLPEDAYDDVDYEDEQGPEGPTDAPWSPVPTKLATDYIRDNDAAIEVLFPAAWSEDSTQAIKNLGTAEALGTISHRRFSEQCAKELGFEAYDYDAEMEAITKDRAPVNPGADFGPPDDVAGSKIVQQMLGPLAGSPGGAAADDSKRADLAGPATAEFIKRQGESAIEGIRVYMQEAEDRIAKLTESREPPILKPEPPLPVLTQKTLERDSHGRLIKVIETEVGTGRVISISEINRDNEPEPLPTEKVWIEKDENGEVLRVIQKGPDGLLRYIEVLPESES